MPRPTRLSLYAFLILLLLGLVLYLPGLSGPLLFDDTPALTGNDLVQISGSTFDEWRTAAFSSHSGPLRRPIAMLSFAANYALAGDFNPTSLKAVNLAIHLCIAVLIYIFSLSVVTALDYGRDSTERKLIAIIAAGCWLLHPLHVSTVLYSVQRMAQLSTLFVVAGLLIFMTYRQRWARLGASSGEIMAGGLWLLLMSFLAVLSKENGALLPWLVLVLEVCLFRGCWAGRRNRYLAMSGWVLFCLPILAIVLLVALSPDSIIGGYRYREFSLEERLLTQARLLWRYLGWIVYPNINDMGFQHDDIPLSTGIFAPWSTALALVAWLLCLVLALRFRHSQPLLLAALLFFLVGHSMESTVLPLEMVYEHRNYLPSVMVFIAAASLLVAGVSRSSQVHIAYPVLGIVAVLSVLLFVRVNTWSSELTLSRVNLQNHPASSRSNFFYANALLRRYRHRGQLGLEEEEAGESLFLARHHFEQMYKTNNRDVAALVLLYYLDSQYFPELQKQIDWLAELERLLAIRVLQPSDWNALETLTECFALGVCKARPERVGSLYDMLEKRHPGSTHVLRYRFNYMLSQGAGPMELLPLLEEAQAGAASEPWVYYGLMSQLLKTGEIDRMYFYAQQWLLGDRERYTLPRLKGLFVNAGGTADLPDE